MEKSILLNEKGLNLRDGSTMILKIIDNQINNYKLQFQTEWEKNHDTKPNEKNQKIAQLEALKQEVINAVKNAEPEDGAISFSLSLNIDVEAKQEVSVEQHEMVA